MLCPPEVASRWSRLQHGGIGVIEGSVDENVGLIGHARGSALVCIGKAAAFADAPVLPVDVQHRPHPPREVAGALDRLFLGGEAGAGAAGPGAQHRPSVAARHDMLVVAGHRGTSVQDEDKRP